MSLNQQIDFEGSDEDIRARFETYLNQLFASINYENDTTVQLEPGTSKSNKTFNKIETRPCI